LTLLVVVVVLRRSNQIRARRPFGGLQIDADNYGAACMPDADIVGDRNGTKEISGCGNMAHTDEPPSCPTPSRRCHTGR
jgi:hypothetical protein